LFFLPSAQCDFNVAVGRYVIMPDHVHLFVRGDYNFRLDAWIGALKQVLAKADMLSRAKGQVRQEGFFDHLLRTNESYSQKWNYVRENPVRAGLVKSAVDLALPRGDRSHRSRLISCSHRPVAGEKGEKPYPS
jgi:REP element-mobilizing transposase RayT